MAPYEYITNMNYKKLHSEKWSITRSQAWISSISICATPHRLDFDNARRKWRWFSLDRTNNEGQWGLSSHSYLDILIIDTIILVCFLQNNNESINIASLTLYYLLIYIVVVTHCCQDTELSSILYQGKLYIIVTKRLTLSRHFNPHSFFCHF